MNRRERLVTSVGEFLQPGFREAVEAPARAVTDEERLARFRVVFHHAWDRVPFHHAKYAAAGLGPESVRSLSALGEVPFLTKEELLGAAPLDARRRPLVALASGGTGGAQARTRLDLDAVLKRYRRLLAILRGLGWRMGEPVAAFHPVEYSLGRMLKNALREASPVRAGFELAQQVLLYRLLHNRLNLYYDGSAFEEDAAADFVSALRRRPPALVLSRPDALFALARGARRAGLHWPSVRRVVCVGAQLTEGMRLELEDDFACQVRNLYASTELGYVGLSCEASGTAVHVDEERCLVEVDPSGELVVTDFENLCMPMIRYRTGDLGEWVGHCSCGRPGRLLRLHGRVRAHAAPAGGSSLREEDLVEFLASRHELQALQLRLWADGAHLSLRPHGLEPARKAAVRDAFIARFGFAPALDADAFARTPSGKHAYIV
ncbi:MAG: hypothetical protein WC969_13455 [Elusimicrobiota bacterium]